MKVVKRSFLDLCLKMKIDHEGYIQESTLTSKSKCQKYTSGEFKFDIKKIKEISPFQKKVYSKLVKVPAGKTITYKELGVKAGYENASRAVGTAMAKNKVILFIPCHRVLQSSGGVGNYSGYGGSSTKLMLLEFEKNGGVV